MNALVVAAACLGPLMLGAPLLEAMGLGPRRDRLAFLAWAWAGGGVTLALLLLGCFLLGVPAAWWGVVPIPAALVLLGCARRARVVDAAPGVADAGAAAPIGWGYGVWVAVLAAFTLLHSVAGAARPCVEGDEGNIWSLKAKTLFAGLGPDFAALQVHNLHPDYPLLNPLLQAWVYALHGGIDHFLNRVPVQAFALALLLALAAALRRRLPALPAGLLLLLCVGAADFGGLARSAYADGMLACGLVLAVDGWLRHAAGEGAAARRLGALGLLLAAWSKNEAALFVVAAVAAASLLALLRRVRFRPGAAAAFSLPALLVLALTWACNAAFGLRNDLLGANPTGQGMLALFVAQFGERFPAVLARAGNEMLAPGSPQGAMLLLLPLCLLLVPRRALAAGPGVPGLALLFSAVGLHLVYVGSHLGLQFHLQTSYTRVLFQLLPAFLVWLAAVGYPDRR